MRAKGWPRLGQCPKLLQQAADGSGLFGTGEGEAAVEFKLVPQTEPILVATFSPIGEVHLGNGVREGWAAGLGKCFDDIAVADAVLNHDADTFADGFRETGDFAVAGAFAMGEEQGWSHNLRFTIYGLRFGMVERRKADHLFTDLSGDWNLEKWS
jgi:hypothetical protein